MRMLWLRVTAMRFLFDSASWSEDLNVSRWGPHLSGNCEAINVFSTVKTHSKADSPKTVVAKWRSDYTRLYAVIGFSVVTVTILGVVLKRRHYVREFLLV